MDLVTPDVGLLFWTVISFFVLLFLLRKFAWKPIVGTVNDRETSIREALESAEKARLEMQNLTADNERILKEARVDSCELFIAVTSSETTNITVCVLAKQLGAQKTIARISNTEFIHYKDEVGFTKFGIDELISPEALAASEIELSLSKLVSIACRYEETKRYYTIIFNERII